MNTGKKVYDKLTKFIKLSAIWVIKILFGPCHFKNVSIFKRIYYAINGGFMPDQIVLYNLNNLVTLYYLYIRNSILLFLSYKYSFLLLYYYKISFLKSSYIITCKNKKRKFFIKTFDITQQLYLIL